MWHLILNELTKIINKKRFFIVYIILFITTLIGVSASIKNTGSEKLPLYPEVKPFQVQLRSVNDRIGILQNMRGSSQNEIKVANLNNLKELAKILEEERNLQLDFKEVEWRKYLEKSVKLTEKRRTLALEIGENELVEDINKELLNKKYHLDNNVKYELKPRTTAFYNMPAIIYYAQRLFILVIMSILISDIISGEQEASTIKMLLTKPVLRGKILLSKFIAGIISTNGIILSLQLLTFVLIGLFYTLGSPNIPFAIGTHYEIDYNLVLQGKRAISPIVGSSIIIPAYQVIIQLLLMQTLLISTCVAFCLMISTIFKSNVASTSVVFFLLIISWIVTFNATDTFKQVVGRTTITQKLIPYIFSSYFDTFSTLVGNFSYNLMNPIATKSSFTVVCIAWIILCYGISHVIFIKKDVL